MTHMQDHGVLAPFSFAFSTSLFFPPLVEVQLFLQGGGILSQCYIGLYVRVSCHNKMNPFRYKYI